MKNSNKRYFIIALRTLSKDSQRKGKTEPKTKKKKKKKAKVF